MRRYVPLALVVLCLSACAKPQDAGTSGMGTLTGSTPSSSAPASAPAPVSTAPTTPAPATSTAPAVPAALKCSQLKSAYVGSPTVKFNGYPDGIPMGGVGLWSGEDGSTVTLDKPCGIGDLDGDGAKDAVGVVDLTTGGTGDFYTLCVWRNKKAKPDFVALADLGDRNPVKSITIADGKATVVYFTRTDDAPMAELNIQRTAVYQLSGHTFSEISHVDVPGEYH
jgi:hypothetical protein